MTLQESEQRLTLILSAQNGDRDAMHALLVSLYPLMCRVGNGFMKQSAGFSVDDLIQEGMLACVDAVRWFDSGKGYQFTTYAADCARRRMWKYLRRPQNRPLPTFAEEEEFEVLNRESAPVDYLDDAEELPVEPGNPLERSIFANLPQEFELGGEG
jgi:RNA polymerase sigma factor (sigma-70 family)